MKAIALLIGVQMQIWYPSDENRPARWVKYAGKKQGCHEGGLYLAYQVRSGSNRATRDLILFIN